MPIDALSFDYVFRCGVRAEEVTAPPDDGVLVTGLWLEGARFDEAAGCLADSLPKQLYTPLPLLHLLPVPNRAKRTGGVYHCPVYKILSRWGVLATTGHSSNYVLSVEVPIRPPAGSGGVREEQQGLGPEAEIVNVAGEVDCGKWIKAGVAAFTQLRY